MENTFESQSPKTENITIKILKPIDSKFSDDSIYFLESLDSSFQRIK